MDIVELFIDEENEIGGIDAISVVENPAIEEDFIALKNQEFKLAEVDKEKRILMGPALIPNKPIYRKNGEDEYYIYFSRQTVRKASELFFIRGNQSRSTLEHDIPLQGLTVVESWIVESETDKLERPKDKSIKDELAEIEEEEKQYILSQIRAIIKKDRRTKKGQRIEMESYSDYPDAVANNAQRGIDLNKKNGNKCATQVGKIRARQLSQKQPISKETLVRMFSYLSRAQEYYDEGDTSACGTISYLLWGGKAGLRWATSKMRELDLLSTELKEPCQKGYEMIGFKMKNGRKVPNCVPEE